MFPLLINFTIQQPHHCAMHDFFKFMHAPPSFSEGVRGNAFRGLKAVSPKFLEAFYLLTLSSTLPQFFNEKLGGEEEGNYESRDREFFDSPGEDCEDGIKYHAQSESFRNARS